MCKLLLRLVFDADNNTSITACAELYPLPHLHVRPFRLFLLCVCVCVMKVAAVPQVGDAEQHVLSERSLSLLHSLAACMISFGFVGGLMDEFIKKIEDIVRGQTLSRDSETITMLWLPLCTNTHTSFLIEYRCD